MTNVNINQAKFSLKDLLITIAIILVLWTLGWWLLGWPQVPFWHPWSYSQSLPAQPPASNSVSLLTPVAVETPTPQPTATPTLTTLPFTSTIKVLVTGDDVKVHLFPQKGSKVIGTLAKGTFVNADGVDTAKREWVHLPQLGWVLAEELSQGEKMAGIGDLPITAGDDF